MNSGGRDLTLVPLAGGQTLVVACDSLGAIGPKPLDAVSAPGEVVGRFTARVPLMEVMAAGAVPVALSVALAVEPDPTGAAILAGVRAELSVAGLEHLPLSISTEKNVATRQTGVGVTAMAVAAAGSLRIGCSPPGAALLCAGLPRVGAAVREGDPAIMDLPALMRLRQLPAVYELLPVGSRGIAAEAAVLAAGSQRRLRWGANSQKLDLAASAGPATCLLLTVAPGALPGLAGQIQQPLTLLGWLE